MSFNLKSLFALIVLSTVSISASADGYFGIKAGLMMIDLGGIRDPFNAGVVFGSNRDAGWGFEGEVTTSLIKGETDFASLDITIKTLAGYAAYRSEGDTYFKGKLGVLYEDIELGSFSDDDSGASYGLGVGWRQGDGSMFELEYTIIEEDINFLSMGINF